MRLPRDVDPDSLIRALASLGYERTRQTGAHVRITTRINGEHHEVVPKHKPIKVGTLQNILASIARHHRLSVQELVAKLRL